MPDKNARADLPTGCLRSLLCILWASNLLCANAWHPVIHSARYKKHWYAIVAHVMGQIHHTEAAGVEAGGAPASGLLPAVLVIAAVGALTLLLPAANPQLEP